jgi:hypothetical protein
MYEELECEVKRILAVIDHAQDLISGALGVMDLASREASFLDKIRGRFDIVSDLIKHNIYNPDKKDELKIAEPLS